MKPTNSLPPETYSWAIVETPTFVATVNSSISEVTSKSKPWVPSGKDVVVIPRVAFPPET